MNATIALPLWRRLLWPSLFFLVSLAILLALGTWQLQRLAWKEALIADVNGRLAADPTSLPPSDQWANFIPDDIRYLRVRVSGTYLHDKQTLSYTVVSKPGGGPHKGQGYWVMTPLQLESGQYVWVNRGFATMAAVEGGLSTPEGVQSVEALIRISEAPNFATPGDDDGFDGSIWFTRNLPAMSEREGLTLSQVAPFFLDRVSANDNQMPQGGETRVTFSNRHFGYALTWYGIALTLVGVFSVLVWREAKKAET